MSVVHHFHRPKYISPNVGGILRWMIYHHILVVIFTCSQLLITIVRNELFHVLLRLRISVITMDSIFIGEAFKSCNNTCLKNRLFKPF